MVCTGHVNGVYRTWVEVVLNGVYRTWVDVVLNGVYRTRTVYIPEA